MEPKKIYKKGFIDGLVAYAHWKDGKQYVGTAGTSLDKAIENVENTWNFNPPEGSDE